MLMITLEVIINTTIQLIKQPFDKSVSFMKLFDAGRKKQLIEAVKKNAVEITVGVLAQYLNHSISAYNLLWIQI